MIDNDDVDEKIIAVPVNDPSYNCYTNLKELPLHIFEEISHFFTVYKQLEGKPTSVREILGPEEAIKIIQDSIDEYENIFISKK